ncbi:MAG: transcriptional regulator [Candidatus Melainabacteria bacterium]|nr:MAG: transcriptional regulator [Candidatus Melainabacteria bacterium]
MADMDILQIVADNIRIERLRKRISQEKLAELVGISTKYLNMIENKKANPTIVVVIKICQTLDITLETIFPIMG